MNRLATNKRLILCLSIHLAVCPHVAATVLFSHIGDADPLSEGWSLLDGRDAVFLSEVPGTAWRIRDASSSVGSAILYSNTLEESDAIRASELGWRLTIEARFPDNAPAINFPMGIVAAFDTGERVFSISFWREADGDPTVGLDAQLAPEFTLEGVGDSDFNSYSLQYDPASGLAHLSVNGGSTVATSSGNPRISDPRVFWGAGSDRYQGVGEFSLVDFEIIPEPSAVLFSMTGLALMLARRRRPNRVGGGF